MFDDFSFEVHRSLFEKCWKLSVVIKFLRSSTRQASTFYHQTTKLNSRQSISTSKLVTWFKLSYCSKPKDLKTRQKIKV